MNRVLRPQQPYELLVDGAFELKSVHAVFDPLRRVKFSANEAAEIERSWSELLSRGEILYDGPLMRVDSFSSSCGELFLMLSLTSFKEYMGTNERLSEASSSTKTSERADPLAVSVVMKSSDSQVLLETRSKRVVMKTKGKLHVKPSGHLTATNARLAKSKVPVPYPLEDALVQEAYEELGVARDEITRIRCTGLVRTLRNLKPELTFVMETAIDSVEVLSRPKAHGWESDSLFAVSFGPEPIHQLLTKMADKFVPAGHGALLLAGGLYFGSRWRESVLKELAAVL